MVASGHHLFRFSSDEAEVEENKDVVESVQYNSTLLRDTTKQVEFRNALINRLQALDILMEEETVEERWKVVKEALLRSTGSEEVH